MQVYPYLVPHKSLLNVGEVFSTDLSEVQTQNERQRVSRKRWEHASCFENLAKPSSIEKRKWIMFSIELFWDQYSKVKVLATRNPRYEEKFRNKSYAFFEFMKPGFALFRPYCSGRAKSGCGVMLAVDIGDFSQPTLRLISWNKCRIHAKFTYINEFHKFWWVFECRNNMYKIWPK